MLKSAGFLLGLLFMFGSAADAALVTFTGIGATEFGWTENGITIDPTLGGAGNHFHDLDGDDQAETFTSDGIPVRITGGGLFSLLSIDFISFSTGAFATFTSSAGGMALINTAGTFDFTGVAGFSNVTFVDFTMNIPPAGEYRMEWDNVNADLAAVPEPSTGAILLAGVIALVPVWRRRQR